MFTFGVLCILVSLAGAVAVGLFVSDLLDVNRSELACTAAFTFCFFFAGIGSVLPERPPSGAVGHILIFSGILLGLSWLFSFVRTRLLACLEENSLPFPSGILSFAALVLSAAGCLACLLHVTI